MVIIILLFSTFFRSRDGRFNSSSFELAEKYRNPVVIVSDGMLAKMMESVELPEKLNKRKILTGL